MNIGISNHYTEQVNVPSINVAEIQSVKRSQKKWTDAENLQLSNYIKEFGENWKKIAENMPGKNPQQCNSHWIRVLKPTIKHGKWTKEEDEQLKNLVSQHGEKWAEIAKEISGRTDMQCRYHYKRSLHSAIKKGEWTEEEDEQLKNLVDQYGEKWAKIAKAMPCRTDLQCRQHYTQTLNPTIKQEKWTQEEDEQLKNLVDQHGDQWAEIAKEMSGRTHTQCSQRYKRTLNPAIKQRKWTKEEDEQLKNLVDQHGKKWVKIAKEMSNRTGKQCWQHYTRALNPAIKQGKWTEGENEQLKNLVDQYGEKWAKIAKEMPGRTDRQCRQHYTQTLNPAIKQEKWTEEDDEQLKNFVDQHGEKWAEIAKEMPGRTDIQCRLRYKRNLNLAIQQKKWTEEENEQLKEAVQRIGEGQWAFIAEEFSDKTPEQCAYHWKILNSKSNKKHSRSEINSSVEERPLKKFKKNHSSQLLDLDENELPLNRQSTPLDQSQLGVLNPTIPEDLQQPVEAIVVISTVQQSLTYQGGALYC